MKIFKSFFEIHNESMNIWTHTFGVNMFIFLALISDSYLNQADSIIRLIDGKAQTQVPTWPLFAHLLSAILCCGFSAFFHLCSVYSKDWFSFMAKLDYSGIILLITGTSIPPAYYTFTCP